MDGRCLTPCGCCVGLSSGQGLSALREWCFRCVFLALAKGFTRMRSDAEYIKRGAGTAHNHCTGRWISAATVA